MAHEEETEVRVRADAELRADLAEAEKRTGIRNVSDVVRFALKHLLRTIPK